MQTKLDAPTLVSNDQIAELLDRYRRRTADIHQMAVITSRYELINGIDVSDLPTHSHTDFNDWLSKRLYVQISIDNALRRGLRVSVAPLPSETPRHADYSIHIKES